MQEEQFSGDESLRLIQSMINKAKNQFSENGHLYLIWGWVVLVCSITQFVLLYFYQYEKSYLVWFACWGAFIYQAIYIYRREKKKYVRTYTDEIIAYVWVAFVILMVLFGFHFGKVLGDDYYKFISPGFLALYGLPTFLSGAILRFRPLVIGGICCWVLSAISAFVNNDFQLLLLGLAVIIAWIIPGYILQNKYRKQSALS